MKVVVSGEIRSARMRPDHLFCLLNELAYYFQCNEKLNSHLHILIYMSKISLWKVSSNCCYRVQ